jgi:hypothetical protein
MRKRPLYEHRLADVLYHIDEATRVQRPYKRVVVKKRGTRKKKRTNGKPMSHAAKVAGWNKAAVAYLRMTQQNVTMRKTSITMDEAAQMDAYSRAVAKRTAGKRLTFSANLIGADYGLLLVWKLSAVEGQVKKFICLCACGNRKTCVCEVAASMLVNGRKKHCGCRLKAKRRQQHCRKQQKLARQGRRRGHWKRHWGMAA